MEKTDKKLRNTNLSAISLLYSIMSIDEFGGNPLRSLPPTSSIRQKKIEQNGKKQHKKTAIALVDLGPKTEIYPS